MPHRLRAVAFDLDAASLVSLREALPGWQIESVNGATGASLARDWDPGASDLLIVGARGDVEDTLGLCRFLAFCSSYSEDSRGGAANTSGLRGGRPDPARRGEAPLLVLVPPGQESLVRALLEAGADACLILPVHAEEVASMSDRVRQGNPPRRHTLGLDLPWCEDRWRDDGGQG